VSEDHPAQTESSEREARYSEFVGLLTRHDQLSWQRDKARDRLVFRESVVEIK
jgi:hypothetical protein